MQEEKIKPVLNGAAKLLCKSDVQQKSKASF